MKQVNPTIRQIWENRTLLREIIVLYLVKKHPKSTRGFLAKKTSGSAGRIPTVKPYLDRLEDKGRIKSEKVDLSRKKLYDYKIVYSITDDGLELLETYKRALTKFLLTI